MNVIALASVWSTASVAVLGLFLTVRYKMKINAMDRRLDQKDHVGALLVILALNPPAPWFVRWWRRTAGDADAASATCRCVPQPRPAPDTESATEQPTGDRAR